MKVNFRFATSEDIHYFYNLILNEKIKVSRQLGIFGIDDRVFNGDEFKVTIVAEVDGKRVACGKVCSAASQLTGYNYISLFYVIKEARRKGIGTELFKYIQDYAFNNWNAVGIDLITIDNPPMEAFAKRFGFSLSGIYKKNYCINRKYYNQSRWVRYYK